MITKLQVLHAGPSISVQDTGRHGHLRFGVTRSGVMDRGSFTLANAALGNPESNPAIEVSLGGLSLTCIEGSVAAAIVGGCFSLSLNGNAIPSWSMFKLGVGDTVTIKPGAWGSWCYVCFAGRLNTTSWLGSQSVHLKSGVCGSAIQTNDVLNLTECADNVAATVSLGNPEQFKPSNAIRVVIGPQDRYFDKPTLASFLENTFRISTDYDRMGMRLEGCSLPVAAALDMPSEPISRGSLQVPGHGDPICLMAEHHTAGGYPKIATVISADFDGLAQHRCGDDIAFKAVSPADAIHAARERHDNLNQWRDQIMLNSVGVTERLWNNNLISGAASGLENDVMFQPNAPERD